MVFIVFTLNQPKYLKWLEYERAGYAASPKKKMCGSLSFCKKAVMTFCPHGNVMRAVGTFHKQLKNKFFNLFFPDCAWRLLKFSEK